MQRLLKNTKQFHFQLELPENGVLGHIIRLL
jgi:hypothetical protein